MPNSLVGRFRAPPAKTSDTIGEPHAQSPEHDESFLRRIHGGSQTHATLTPTPARDLPAGLEPLVRYRASFFDFALKFFDFENGALGATPIALAYDGVEHLRPDVRTQQIDQCGRRQPVATVQDVLRGTNICPRERSCRCCGFFRENSAQQIGPRKIDRTPVAASIRLWAKPVRDSAHAVAPMQHNAAAGGGAGKSPSSAPPVGPGPLQVGDGDACEKVPARREPRTAQGKNTGKEGITDWRAPYTTFRAPVEFTWL